ncbi:hypothetical protein Lser_V15G32284 [Lactuca serriola]
MALTKSKTSCSKKLEKLKTPPLQGPLSRAFSRSALCNVRSLTSPPIDDLKSSLSTGDLGSSISTSDLGLTSRHRRLQRLLKFANPKYD